MVLKKLRGRIKARRTARKSTSSPAPRQVQGPTRPGISVSTFRATGKSVPSGGSTPRPTSTPIPTSTPRPPPSLQKNLISAGLPKAQAKAISIRQQIKQKSLEGAKGLSRLQIQRKLGGAKGVSALRKGTSALREKKVSLKSFIPLPPKKLKPIKKSSLVAPDVKKSFKGKNIGKAIDFVSLGALSSKEFRTRQENINKDIESFNKEFVGRGLPDEEFNQAEKELDVLEQRAEKLEKDQEEFEEKGIGKIKKKSREVGVKISGKVTAFEEKRILNAIERAGIEPTEANLERGKRALDKQNEQLQQDVNILLLGATSTPRALSAGGKVLKPAKIKKTKGTQLIKKTKEQLAKIKEVRAKLDKIEKDLKKSGNPISLQNKKFNLKPSKKQLAKIKKARERIAKFEKNLEKQLKKDRKEGKPIPLSQKKVQLKPSKEKLKRILATRKRLAKFEKKLGKTKRLKKFEKEKLRKIISTRKRLKKFEKKLGTEKKLKKFEKEKLKRILATRKRLKKFEKKLGTEKKLKKFEKEKLKRILATRKRLKKFEKQKVKPFVRTIRLRQKRIPTKKKLPSVKPITFTKTEVKGITFTKTKPQIVPSGTTQQILRGSPQEFQSRISNALKRMSPEQRIRLNQVVKELRRRAETKRFNLNNELIKQGRQIKLTQIQKLALKRGRENLSRLNKDKNKFGRSIKQISNEQEKVSRRINTLQKSKASSNQIQKQRVKQRNLQKQKSRQFQKFKRTQKQINKFNKQSFSTLFAFSVLGQRGLQRASKQKINLGQKQLRSTSQRQPERQRQRIRSRVKQIQKTKQVSRQKPRARVKQRPFIIKRKKPGQKKIVQRRIKSHNVFARPLKRTKKGRRPKLIKVNKVPLSKRRAKDVRNFVTDTSLARTAKIKPGKGKPKESRLRVPRGFSKRTSRKFRRFRVVKGKRVALPKGKVIERGKHLLDTRGEKRQITLKKRIAQITKPKRKKLSSAQLNALSKGREKRAKNLRKR